MNYLAHLSLSVHSADLQRGNYLADLIKGKKAVEALPPGIRSGILMHRAIDRLTDAAAEVRTLNRLLSARHARYAPVITDIAFDYYLFRNWQQFNQLPFTEFCQLTYDRLLCGREQMPPGVRGYVDGMVAADWLRQYTTRDGLLSVYRRLRKRMSKPALLDGIEITLEEHGEVFNHTFLLLFPRLQDLASTYRAPASTD